MIYVLGSTGMIGKYIFTYLSRHGYDVVGVTHKDIDALDTASIERFTIALRDGDVVINAIGITNKKMNGVSDDYIYNVNTWFPRTLSSLCSELYVNMYHLSTDCVFSGADGYYIETDIPDANHIYGISKYHGEPPDCAVIRTSCLGEGEHRELLGWVLSHTDSVIDGYTDHWWNGVTCLRLAKVLAECIDKEKYWKGVKHISSQFATKYHLVCAINKLYQLNNHVRKVYAPTPIDRTLMTDRRDIKFPMYNVFTDLIDQKHYKL